MSLQFQNFSRKTQITQIIIAALNEEHGIAYTLAELKEYLNKPQILLVDGNSNDRTVEVAKQLGANVIYQGGIGKGDALSAGFKHIQSDVDYVVLLDADFTYPAEHIPRMISILNKHQEIGMVCGNRFNSTYPLEGMKGIFHIGNTLIRIAHSLLTGINLKDPLTGLRVVRAELLRSWNPKSNDFDIEVELNVYIENQGFKIVEVPIAYRSRIGLKKLKTKHGFSIFKRIIVESIK